MSENESRVLTIHDLNNADACYTYTSLFRERFPEGSVDMTVDLAVSQAKDWDWYFAAGAFLRDRTDWNSKINEAERQYIASTRPYRELLSSARVEARKLFEDLAEKHGYYTDEYYKAYSEVDVEFQRRMAVPRAAYNAAVEAADLAVSTAKARAFAEQYIAEGGMPLEVDEPCDCDSCVEDRVNYND